jgi:Abnormal spindle-like microcephaly-assoc'd, ASPM-SPD-2-Hydin
MRNAACPRIFSSKSHPTVLLQMAATILAVGAMVSLGACGGGAGASAAPPAPKPSPAGVGNLAVSPTTISFANVAIGQTAMQQVTLTNQGTVQITVQTAVVSGAGLSVTGLITPLSIAPLQTANFEIQFIPLAVGAPTSSSCVISAAPKPENEPQHDACAMRCKFQVFAARFFLTPESINDDCRVAPDRPEALSSSVPGGGCRLRRPRSSVRVHQTTASGTLGIDRSSEPLFGGARRA